MAWVGDYIWNAITGTPENQNPATAPANQVYRPADAGYYDTTGTRLNQFGNLSQGQRDFWYQRLMGAQERGATQQEVDAILNDAAAEDYQAGFQGQTGQLLDSIQAQQQQSQSNYDAAKAEAEANKAAGLAGVDKIEQQFLPEYNQRIDRYQGILSDPNKIYSDPELAGRLTEVENALAGQLNEIRGNVAKDYADAGVRASGKVNNRLSNAGLQATYLKGKNTSDVLRDVSGAIPGLQGARQSFVTGLENSRNAIRNGGFADTIGLNNLGLQASQLYGNLGLSGAQSQYGLGPNTYSSGGLTGLDTAGLYNAQQNQNLSTGLNFVGPLLQAGLSAPSQFAPFVKGWG